MHLRSGRPVDMETRVAVATTAAVHMLVCFVPFCRTRCLRRLSSSLSWVSARRQYSDLFFGSAAAAPACFVVCAAIPVRCSQRRGVLYQRGRVRSDQNVVERLMLWEPFVFVWPLQETNEDVTDKSFTCQFLTVPHSFRALSALTRRPPS